MGNLCTKRDLKLDLICESEHVSKIIFSYNISSFINEYQNMGQKWDNLLDTFIHNIDERVRVQPNEPELSPIIHGMEHIVDEICQGLSNKIGAVIQKRESGSLYANVRTGLPIEADFLLEMPAAYIQRCKQQSATQDIFSFRHLHYSLFQTDVYEVVKNLFPQFDPNSEWRMYGLLPHGAGVCLAMAYRRDGITGRSVGVLVDLVPAYMPGHADRAVFRLKPKAKDYMMHNNMRVHINEDYSIDFASYRYTLSPEQNTEYGNQYACGQSYGTFSQLSNRSNALHMLLKGLPFKAIDTGILEHDLLRSLSENKKRPLRIAKYILQTFLVTEEPCINTRYGNQPFLPVQIDCLCDTERRLHVDSSKVLYGFEPEIKSYLLKLLFEHLLFCIHGTEIEDRFSEAAVVICLLDMVYQILKFAKGKRDSKRKLNIIDPVQSGIVWQLNLEEKNLTNLLRRLQTISCAFLKHTQQGESSMNYYPFNSSSTGLYSPSSGIQTYSCLITGFCRGLWPSIQARRHDCDMIGCKEYDWNERFNRVSWINVDGNNDVSLVSLQIERLMTAIYR